MEYACGWLRHRAERSCTITAPKSTKFVEVPVAAMMGSVLDSFPANSDVVDFIASRLHRTSDGALLQEVLLVALDDACSVEDNSRLDYAIRRLSFTLPWAFLWKNAGWEDQRKAATKTTSPQYLQDLNVVRSRSPSERLRMSRQGDSVEVDDTRQYYTIISDSGKQRQTVAERLP